MLPHKRPSFFRMTFETEFVDRIGIYHFISAGPAAAAKTDDRLGAKSPHRIVATGAFQHLSSDKRFFYWVMGLFINLTSDVPMTVETKVRLCRDQQLIYSLVYRVAAIT
jgi:hypothetical protein